MLNSKIWRLRDLLADGFERSTQDIMFAIKEYGVYNQAISDNSNSTAIRTDILKFNESEESHKIIIYRIVEGYYFFKLASNEKEAMEFAESIYKEKAIKALVRYSAIVRKVKANGQGRLISTKGDVIDDESKAARFVETYIAEQTQVEEQAVQLTLWEQPLR